MILRMYELACGVLDELHCLWRFRLRCFAPDFLPGAARYDSMPITAADAAHAGWTAINGGACNAHKGIEFAQSTLPGHEAPRSTLLQVGGRVVACVFD